MLVENEAYKRNEKTGEIIKRQKVLLKCDDCKIKWETNYDFVKRKRKAKGKDAKDYCVKCRQKPVRIIFKATRKPKKKIICLGCSKEFLRMPSKIRKNNFCSWKCRDAYNFEIKYDHLHRTFDSNPNEVAYLFGLILGDGHLRKVAENTTRVSIGFDVKYDDLIDIFKDVAKKLEIKYFVEPKKHSNCQAIGFALPDRLLEKYSMLYSGAKYSIQPRPVDGVIDNINFAAGLVNSDGWCSFRRKKYREIGFVNTVFSIADCFEQSLKNNDMYFNTYYVDGKLDKRTGNIGKDGRVVKMMRNKEIDKFIKKVDIGLKEFR